MITSSDNKQIKEVNKLILRARERKTSGLYVIEGSKLFNEAPSEDIERIYVSEAYEDKSGRLKEFADITETVKDDVFKKMTDTLTPQGILCVLKMRRYSLEDMLENPGERPVFLVLENLQDPGNLGTIMRTAEGAGVKGIIMSADTVDLYNPKTVRSTMGSIFRVPFIYVDDLKEAINKVKKAGIPCYAAHLKGVKDYKNADYSRGACFFIGNEGNGLTDETAAEADEYIIIPMKGRLESLNAAVSAALLMYQV